VATPETEERLLAAVGDGWTGRPRPARPPRQHASRALHVYPDSDGTVILRGRLTAEVGALLVQALAAARETLYQQA
jgi:hypothetical protein